LLLLGTVKVPWTLLAACEQADVKVFKEGRWPLIAPLPNYGCGHCDRSPQPNPQPSSCRRWAPFLDGYDVANLTIGGENGTIDGSGLFWWARHELQTEVYTRPPLFSCVRCTDMLLEDTTFKNSAFWCAALLRAAPRHRPQRSWMQQHPTVATESKNIATHQDDPSGPGPPADGAPDCHSRLWAEHGRV
jgi:hypothetical protein